MKTFNLKNKKYLSHFTLLLILVALLASCSAVPTRVPKIIYESSLKADKIIVDKSEQKLLLYKNNKIIRNYDATFGKIEGPKIYEGDKKTPEGKYFISNKNPRSKFFLSLAISYPNVQDRARAAAVGKPAGHSIMIHGQPNKSSLIERMKNEYKDWTDGCIAVSDRDMIEIYAMVDVHTPITIRP